MLVLSRKINETVIIAGNIKVVVVEIRGDKVRLGFEAPKDVTVHRSEVADSIAFHTRSIQAAKSNSPVVSIANNPIPRPAEVLIADIERARTQDISKKPVPAPLAAFLNNAHK